MCIIEDGWQMSLHTETRDLIIYFRNDFIISQVSQHHIKGTIVLGTGDTKENCIIRYPRDYHIMKIEVPSREHSKIDYSAVPLSKIL